MKPNLYQDFLQKSIAGQKQLALLIDPDKVAENAYPTLASWILQSPPDMLLVGGSLITSRHQHELMAMLRKLTALPVLIFPGSYLHISAQADAILLLSLISGRNPEFLIGNHVLAAPALKRSGLEIIPTGYLLIDCGRPTTVAYMSNTTPIPYDKPDIAATTALAGEMLGLKMTYLEGGSGAAKPVSTDMIAAVRASLEGPLMVGGGIRSTAQLEAAYAAGADIAVVGTAIEEQPQLLPEMVALRDRLNLKAN